jgi:predicted HTH domain antitoxin
MQFKLDYPDTLPGLLKMNPEELNQELRFIIAGKLYDMGKLSSGKAAELAGVSKIIFLSMLKKYDLHAINIDAEQIEHEIQSAKELSS